LVAKVTCSASSIPKPTAPTIVPGGLVKICAVVNPLKTTGVDQAIVVALMLELAKRITETAINENKFPASENLQFILIHRNPKKLS
jgi:hypothetical protein